MSKKRTLTLACILMFVLCYGIYFIGNKCVGSTSSKKPPVRKIPANPKKQNSAINSAMQKATNKFGKTYNSKLVTIAKDNKPITHKKNPANKEIKILATGPVTKEIANNKTNPKNNVHSVKSPNKQIKTTTNQCRKKPAKKPKTTTNDGCCYTKISPTAPKKQKVANTPNPNDAIHSVTKIKKSVYMPYIQAGASHSFSKMDFSSTKIDLFIPIWQRPDKMIFSDLRGYFPIGSGYEGNLHFGYRQILPNDKILLGAYVAYDRKKPNGGNYFNQVTLGLEAWVNSWFVGANFYKPFGKTSFLSKEAVQKEQTLATIAS